MAVNVVGNTICPILETLTSTVTTVLGTLEGVLGDGKGYKVQIAPTDGEEVRTYMVKRYAYGEKTALLQDKASLAVTSAMLDDLGVGIAKGNVNGTSVSVDEKDLPDAMATCTDRILRVEIPARMLEIANAEEKVWEDVS